MLNQTLKRSILIVMLTMLTAFGVSYFSPKSGAQDIAGSLQCGANLEVSGLASGEGCENPQSAQSAAEQVDQIVSTIINVLSLPVGVVAVIMIIVGGLKYVTSGGESGNVTGAKNTILYAVVGLVVVALAQIIVRFVVNRTTQATTTTID